MNNISILVFSGMGVKELGAVSQDKVKNYLDNSGEHGIIVRRATEAEIVFFNQDNPNRDTKSMKFSVSECIQFA